MKKTLTFAACLGLIGCNTPSIPFRGIDPTRVTVEGSTFDVRVKGLWAEAIRTNSEYAPRFGPIRERAKVAIEQVSRCHVARTKGDQAHILAALDCGAGAPPVPKKAPDYDCYVVRDVDIFDRNSKNATIDCDAKNEASDP